MLEGWFFIAAALLIVSGGTKIVDPAPTRGALEAARLPSGAWTAPVLGTAEIGAGVAGVVIGGAAAWLPALAYAGFAAFVIYALRRRLPIQSCGCFGRADTPPSLLHVIFNLISVAAAGAVAVSASRPLETLDGQPLAGVPYLGFVALGVWLVYLALAQLPTTLAASRGEA